MPSSARQTQTNTQLTSLPVSTSRTGSRSDSPPHTYSSPTMDTSSSPNSPPPSNGGGATVVFGLGDNTEDMPSAAEGPFSAVADQQFPPLVARSQDGEEGYANSQHQLQVRNCDLFQSRHNQRKHCGGGVCGGGIVNAIGGEDSGESAIRPPPNRTVHDSESPPPYSMAASTPRAWTFGCHDEHAKLARAVAERHRAPAAAGSRYRGGGVGTGNRGGSNREEERCLVNDAFDAFSAAVAFSDGPPPAFSATGSERDSVLGTTYGSPRRTTRILSAPSHLRTTSPNNTNNNGCVPSTAPQTNNTTSAATGSGVSNAAACLNHSHQHQPFQQHHHHPVHHPFNGVGGGLMQPSPPPPYHHPPPPEYTPSPAAAAAAIETSSDNVFVNTATTSTVAPTTPMCDDAFASPSSSAPAVTSSTSDVLMTSSAAPQNTSPTSRGVMATSSSSALHAS